ncbi:unnamed protein product [Sphagnum jensenii]|uniref:Uncharacterized protein n=1 Tax=Sphagnum jensenii TaxID=128206 RepID=A0ABP1B2S8_9BRYO
MLAASLGPEVVEQEAPEDVKGLMSVGETARMVAVEVCRVIDLFENGLSEEDKRPGDLEAVWCPPIVPYPEECILSLLGRGALHEAMLGGFRESLITALAGGRDTHDLEPSADW